LRVAARALEDDSYRDRLIADPASVLREEGLTVPENVEIEVHQNTPTKVHLVLPPGPPAEGELDLGETNVLRLMAHWPV
jgi:hypothetical protein